VTPPRDQASAVGNLAQLLAHALAIEIEAEDRYRILADQMETHNNVELATLFAKLSTIEAKHALQIAERAKGMELPDLKPWEYCWQDFESPESIDPTDLDYRMVAHQALRLALAAEERAFLFFDLAARQATDKEVATMASELAEEERGHVELVKRLLSRYPPPAKDWDEDPDPPVSQ
jgi:rubrerythrin